MNVFIGLVTSLVGMLVGGWFFTRPKQGVRGIWRTRGHGMVLKITPFVFEQYEVSQRGTVRALRVPASTWLLKRMADVKLVGDGAVLHVEYGGLTPILAERIDHVPTNLITDSDPETVFELFWHGMNEHYAFFDLYGVDWQARYDEFRAKVSASTSEDELFDIMTASMAGLDDRHVSLRGNKRAFSPGRKPAWITTAKMSQQVLPYNAVTDGYLNKLQRIKDVAVTYGWLKDSLAYVRFDRMVTSGVGEARTAPIRKALELISAEFQQAKAIVVDVRHNPGGSDDFSFAIAEAFTSERRLALTKSTRLGDGYTEPEAIYLAPKGSALFTMPVYLLTSEVTFSAAEIFAWVMSDMPQVTVVGERSGGGLSDILSRTLPNGWEVGLSNQRYLREDGSSYEGIGIPVDIVREVDVAGFPAGYDTLLEEIIVLASINDG